ncbi:hypothetical protein [Occallatibacter savannae]|uniref:hypothetical protein n=1 Tax=Occallatibacter savannae TaxID=1002691 RepID=UPI000D6993DC|nr:hypothetical protein [Occallatibacter savannae]
MLTAPILYVGDDICHRVPVFERLGVRVRRIPCSERALCDVLDEDTRYSAVTFNEDLEPIPDELIAIISRYPAPIVLFENACIAYKPESFDLIIPALTPPGFWLQCIQATIDDSMRLRAESTALRIDAAAVRSDTREHRARMHRLIPTPIDLDEIWRIDWNTGRPASFPAGHDDLKKSS